MTTASKISKLIVGLGNPTEQYAYTYHNVGQLALEYFTVERSAPWKTPRACHFSYRKDDQRTLVKPATFMNESGGAIAEALEYFGVPPHELVVLHDDSDIPLGSYKLSFGSGAAGHKGVKSIINVLGTNKFARIRIGIPPPQETRKAEAFVLRQITKNDRKIFEAVMRRAVEELETPTKTQNSQQ